LATAEGERLVPLSGPAPDWPPRAIVEPGSEVAAGAVLARTDSERAYVVMLARYLPAGLLGLAVAGLLAAFMSTVDTHVNLAASFFVNDVWRRFLVRDADARHYVRVARWASLGVMLAAALLAVQAESISSLFQFFLALLGGVGPVYLLRWVWWRVRAVHEITAMLASCAATVTLTFWSTTWHLGPLSPGGELAEVGRLLLVVGFSLAAVLVALAFTRPPDPASLLPFYRRVRPIGAWGPVAALAPEVRRDGEGAMVALGVAGGLLLVYGATLGIGFFVLGRQGPATAAALAVVAGALAVRVALGRLVRR
jgi:Na+(H+)/acetate symporter ActP